MSSLLALPKLNFASFESEAFVPAFDFPTIDAVDADADADVAPKVTGSSADFS